MEQYKLNTIQNISIDRPIASVAERMVATIIDFVIIGIYYLFLIFALGLANHNVWLILLSIPVFLYSLIFELIMDGQSLGKKILKLKVYSENGGDVSFSSLFIRWVFRLIDVLLLLGSVATLSIILSKRNQRIGDMVGNTIILNIRESKKSASLFFDLPTDYKLVIPEVENLDMNDIKIVNDVIGFLKSSYYSDDARAYAVKTKEKIEQKLQIKSNIDSVKFLYTIIKDYNFIHQPKNN